MEDDDQFNENDQDAEEELSQSDFLGSNQDEEDEEDNDDNRRQKYFQGAGAMEDMDEFDDQMQLEYFQQRQQQLEVDEQEEEVESQQEDAIGNQRQLQNDRMRHSGGREGYL